VPQLFTEDHLGSVPEVTDGTSTLIARYMYDPWGRRALATGTDVTSVGYTQHVTHNIAGVFSAPFRAYDPAIGRWISEDPLGAVDGPNLYR
jgi:RHS repeat-associated protein